MNKVQQPLSNLQLEILKTFSYNLSDAELQEFRGVLAKYFADRAIQAADKVWTEKGWTDKDMDDLLNTKLRKSK